MRRIVVLALLVIAAATVLTSDPIPGANSGDEPKKLSLWGIYDLQDVYQPVIDAFQQQHSGTEIEYKQFPDAEQYHQLLIKQLKEGRGPDIFLFPDHRKEQYWGFLNPTSDQVAEGFARVARADLVEEGLSYALPLWIDSLVLYYNRRYYPEGIQKQWYDFAEQTREINTGGIAMGRLDNMRYGWDILKALFLQKEVSLAGPAQESLYDTLEFFNRFAYPIDRYFNWNEKLSRDYPDLEVDSFAREKVAAIAGYASLLHFIQTKSDQLEDRNFRNIDPENIAVTTFPQFTPDNPSYLAKYFALGVSVHSDHPNEAWEFIELLTSVENARYYLQATGRTPGRLLPVEEGDSQLTKVQKQQLSHTDLMRIPMTIREQLEPIIQLAIKDKRVLREIMDLSF